MAKRRKIIVLKGPNEGKDFEIEDSIKIGRHSDNDIVFEDPAVSRFHAEIEKKTPFYYIKNISSNGTRLNNNAVVDPVRLRHGDMISIGKSIVLRFSVSDDNNHSESNQATICAMKKYRR